MNKENNCPEFEIDDWGICVFKQDYDIEDCENNCLIELKYKSQQNDSLL